MEAKAGPSGHLRPEAAGLSVQEHSATAGRGPAMEEHSDLDEQRPQRAWTKVSGGPNRGERNDQLLGSRSSFQGSRDQQLHAANRNCWGRLTLAP